MSILHLYIIMHLMMGFGKIIGINDLVSFEGTNVKEHKAAFKEAVEDYLDISAQSGKQPDKNI